MDRCPYCRAELGAHDRVCRECDARKAYLVFGGWFDGGAALVLKGIVAPALALPLCALGWLFKPMPAWFGIGAAALAIIGFTIYRLRAGQRWIQIQ